MGTSSSLFIKNRGSFQKKFIRTCSSEMTSTVFVLQLLFASGFASYEPVAFQDVYECLASDEKKDLDVTGVISECYQETSLTGDVCADFNTALEEDHCFVESMNWTTITTEGETKPNFDLMMEESNQLMAKLGVSGEDMFDCLYQTKEHLQIIATYLAITYHVDDALDASIAGCSTQISTNRHDWYKSAMARCAIRALGSTC